MTTILIIEDELKTAELIQLYLEKDGYRVLSSQNGEDGLDLALKAHPDLLILDRMLPGMEGLEILKKLRAQTNIPVIFLSAKSDEIEKVVGLEMGADDYLSKPFSPKELLARVKSVLRRSKQSMSVDVQKNLSFQGLTLDPSKMLVQLDGETISMSAKEFKLLQLLAGNPGHVYTREQLMQNLYESSQTLVFDRTIDAHIKNLRKRLKDNPKKPRFIASVFGVGYKFIDHEAQS